MTARKCSDCTAPLDRDAAPNATLCPACRRDHDLARHRRYNAKRPARPSTRRYSQSYIKNRASHIIEVYNRRERGLIDPLTPLPAWHETPPENKQT